MKLEETIRNMQSQHRSVVVENEHLRREVQRLKMELIRADSSADQRQHPQHGFFGSQDQFQSEPRHDQLPPLRSISGAAISGGGLPEPMTGIQYASSEHGRFQSHGEQ